MENLLKDEEFEIMKKLGKIAREFFMRLEKN